MVQHIQVRYSILQSKRKQTLSGRDSEEIADNRDSEEIAYNKDSEEIAYNRDTERDSDRVREANRGQMLGKISMLVEREAVTLQDADNI